MFLDYLDLAVVLSGNDCGVVRVDQAGRLVVLVDRLIVRDGVVLIFVARREDDQRLTRSFVPRSVRWLGLAQWGRPGVETRVVGDHTDGRLRFVSRPSLDRPCQAFLPFLARH
jgi:hypothetical protein